MAEHPEGEATDPPTPEADDKDWTWTLARPCPDCGFDPAAVAREQLPALVHAATERWIAVLHRPGVAQRPEPTVWSPLEYACHVRDVLRLFAQRAWAIRREDDPVFANWDQDQTALLERYWQSDPAAVAVEISAAGPRAADAFDAVADAEWARPGMRSNGSRFTLESLGVYFLHDVHHHLWDVQG
jgi:hypothetical protein